MTTTTPDFFLKNISLLQKNHPKTWELLNQSPPLEPSGEIFLAPNGKPNLWALDQEGNRIPLHLLDDPEAEISQFLGMVDVNFAGVVTLTGMGLGYTPLALIQQRPNMRHLVVLEPASGIFLQALHALDLTPLLTDPRTIIGVGPEPNIAAILSPATTALQLESINNLQHLPSFSLNFPLYKQLQTTLYDYCSSFNIEGNTLDFMGRDFLENRLHHLNSMHHNRFLAELDGKFKNKPAIIVSAGPSLDKNVHLLAQAKGKAVILVADSALPTMVAQQIMPDFVGTIDPLELIFEKVAGVASQVHDLALLCMSWASCKMAKLFPADQIFWGFGANPIEAWMTQLFGHDMLTAGAGSVAHLNLLTAIIMKCSPIIFIGQDLSFSPEKSHSADTVLQTNDLVSKLLTNTDDIVWLDGIAGGKVLSNRGMHNVKVFFERIITDQKGHYINATEGGCHIEGTEVMPFQQALDTYCREPVGIAEVIHPSNASCDLPKIRKHLQGEFRKITREGVRLAKMIDRIDQLSQGLRQWLTKAEKGERKFRSFAELPPPVQKRMSELDKLNKQVDSAHLIWQLLKEVTIGGVRQSEQQKHALTMLANDPLRYTEWLRKSADRFLLINKVRREFLPLLTDNLTANIDFLQKEELLLATLAKEKKEELRTLPMVELARLYYNTGNLVLARPWIEKLRRVLPDSAEINFWLGWIAAHHTEYEQAEEFFTKAAHADPEYRERIATFREKQGNAYIKYALHFATNDKGTYRRLLAKGLRYAPDHREIKQRLIALSDQVLATIKTHEAEGNLGPAEEISRQWLTDLAGNNAFATILGPNRIATLHRARALFLAAQNDYAQAAAAFGQALQLTPEDPALHISITDMYFAMDLYPQGIAHLEQAVALDSVYAVYWEEIGDSLAEAGQLAEAITAYEKCFTILPERIHLLKKMGDCYLATEQLEAAREAYLQLKLKMQALESVPA